MKEIEVPKAYGNSTFCDDIRQEVGGKLSYMGVYNGSMTIHVPFPVLLPKFVIGITYFEKHNQVTSDVSFRVFMPGDAEDAPSARMDVPMAEHRAKTPPLVDPEFKTHEPVRRADFAFPFTPFLIQQRGFIRVRAFLGDEIVKLGSLKIDQQTTDPLPGILGPIEPQK